MFVDVISGFSFFDGCLGGRRLTIVGHFGSLQANPKFFTVSGFFSRLSSIVVSRNCSDLATGLCSLAEVMVHVL
jgi:hypothetical protein